MDAVPVVTPVTIPVRLPTVAIIALELSQLPPAVALVSVVVVPGQIEVVPTLLATNAPTEATMTV